MRALELEEVPFEVRRGRAVRSRSWTSPLTSRVTEADRLAMTLLCFARTAAENTPNELSRIAARPCCGMWAAASLVDLHRYLRPISRADSAIARLIRSCCDVHPPPGTDASALTTNP